MPGATSASGFSSIWNTARVVALTIWSLLYVWLGLALRREVPAETSAVPAPGVPL